MVFSKTLIDNIKRLMHGESVASSAIRKDFADILLNEGLITVNAHGSRRSYSAINISSLKIFLQSQYEELKNIDNDIILSNMETISRAEQAVSTGNSKIYSVRSCPGFPINSYERISCKLKDNEFVVNPQEGSFLFVTDWKNFAIPQDVIVVGIENMENFRMIQRQKKLFDEAIGDSKILFVSRYPQSSDLRSWLQQINNRYVHFGDFDLAGINIFLTEFHKYIGNRSSFLIPSDIKRRLENGSTKRYDNQWKKFNSLKTEITELQILIDLINTFHKCYDQEGYIEINL
ncbi:MAG: hypothetical protein II981_09800 [Bacteroidales bacterium]|nr:hypothetical protein [Bacteroidales bacterium]